MMSFMWYTGDVWDPEEAEAIQRVSEHIASSESSAAVCLICLETMDSSAAVWQCHKSCHCVFHLLCIQVCMFVMGVLPRVVVCNVSTPRYGALQCECFQACLFAI
jgi:hypothetical protein